MSRVIVAVALASALNGSIACAEQSGASDQPYPGLRTPSYRLPVFTVSPIDPDQIREIIPLGNLNPRGGHVFPTDHVYLNYGSQPGPTVMAPAAGTVIAVRDQLRGDSKIEIRVDENISYYVAHLDLEAGIAAGSKVSAGQKLGRASGKSMLDLGAADARVRLTGFLSPDRYPQPTLHTISPLALFSEPLRTELYGKVKRKGTDQDGKIDLDRPGRLAGNWFHQSLSAQDSSHGEPQVWARQLSFAYDVHDPKAVRISIGGTIASAGLYAVLAGAPDPAEVRVETGPVKFQLNRMGADRSGALGQDRGTLQAQVLNEQELKIEYFAGKGPADVTGFTQKASNYVR